MNTIYLIKIVSGILTFDRCKIKVEYLTGEYEKEMLFIDFWITFLPLAIYCWQWSSGELSSMNLVLERIFNRSYYKYEIASVTSSIYQVPYSSSTNWLFNFYVNYHCIGISRHLGANKRRLWKIIFEWKELKILEV